MKYSKNEWLSALVSGFFISVVFLVLVCLAIKWFRGGGYVWFGFEPAAAGVEALSGLAVTL